MKNIFKGLLYLFLFCICHCCFAQEPSPIPVAQQGIIDLRQQNISTTPVALNGEWLFFWNQLLSPKDGITAKPHAIVRYPSFWKNDSFGSRLLPSQGYASYMLTVLLPKDHPALAFTIPDTYASYAFYVNGILLAKNGTPAATAEQAIPFWSTQVVRIPDGADSLSIVMQVANFWHAKGGTYKPILIGEQDQLLLNYHRDIAFDLVLTGCLFMGGLFFLGLYLFGRHDRAILYFSLFCIVYSYRLIGTDIYVLHSLFPSLSWFIAIRLEYLSLCIGLALFGQYTRHLYPDDVHPILIKILVGCCALFSLIIIFTPPLVFTHCLNTFLGLMFGYTAYAFFVYVKASRHNRSGSVYALLSTVVMMLIFLLMNLHYFHVVPELKAIIFTCYIAFFFLQSLALSQRFAQTFKQAATQAQAGMQIKSEFLSTMSHEIRTPLNSVIGMTHLLRSGKPREDQQKHLDVLYFSANNLLSIVNNILDYNKIEAGKISFEQIPFDLGAIGRNITEGLKNAAVEKHISMELIIDKHLPAQLVGDPTRTSQVINNLVHNAIKFTEKGFVRLSICVSSVQEGSVSVTVSVEDTGIGIPLNKQQVIFDRFTQADSSTSRNFGGTGLGLAITRKILELQDVVLQLKSEPGKGSIFSFKQTFPISISNSKAEKETGDWFTDESGNLQGLSVLLVEDNVLNIMVAQTILEKKGALVDVANNGQEALDNFNACKHQVILMDLNMPVMDGYQATQIFRKQGETVPIIALTASMPKEIESEAYAAGITDIVMKPFNPQDLYHTILRHVQPAVQ